MKLQGAHVVVTGGSQGIGAAMARVFAEKGSRVSLVARNTEAIKRLAGELDGQAFTADLLDSDVTDELIRRIEHDAGPIDVLANNAGLESDTFFHNMEIADIRRLTTLNLEVPMVLTRNVLPGMIERDKGHLVFTSSLAGTGGFPGLTAYGATKAGLSNFNAGIRLELRDTNINTTLVAPGPVDTVMWDHLEDSADMGPTLKRLRRAQLIPKKSPEYIAKQAVEAVASDRRHARTPRRLLANHLFREVPSRLTEVLLTGVKIGPQSSTKQTEI